MPECSQLSYAKWYTMNNLGRQVVVAELCGAFYGEQLQKMEALHMHGVWFVRIITGLCDFNVCMYQDVLLHSVRLRLNVVRAWEKWEVVMSAQVRLASSCSLLQVCWGWGVKFFTWATSSLGVTHLLFTSSSSLIFSCGWAGSVSE